MFEGFETETVDVGGAGILTRRAGSGPPLLLLHGNPQTHAMWHLVAPKLAEDFTVVVTDLRYLQGYPVSLFLELDPLVGFATAITTTTVYKGLILCTLLLIPTFVLGRFFCNWVCPYGTLHQLTGWLFGRRDEQARIESNRFKKLQQLKYVFLIMMIMQLYM